MAPASFLKRRVSRPKGIMAMDNYDENDPGSGDPPLGSGDPPLDNWTNTNEN